MKIKFEIDYQRCKQCGICMYFCPKNVFDKNEDGSPNPVRVDDCIFCQQCVKRCPDFAMNIKKEEEND